MTKVTVPPAIHITLTYSGHGKHTATWKDSNGKTVRRTINLDQWHDVAVAALEAAEHYVDWCNVRLAEWDAGCVEKLSSVTISSLDADRHAVAVTMRAEAISTEVAA